MFIIKCEKGGGGGGIEQRKEIEARVKKKNKVFWIYRKTLVVMRNRFFLKTYGFFLRL